MNRAVAAKQRAEHHTDVFFVVDNQNPPHCEKTATRRPQQAQRIA
jgi:hypothetical protein